MVLFRGQIGQVAWQSIVSRSVDSSSNQVSLEVQREIDVRCDAFESKWRSGDAPRLSEFLEGIAEGLRGPLLRELLVIEFQYRRSPDGKSASDQELIEAHPELEEELVKQLATLR